MKEELTLGEYRVGKSFNPSGNKTVTDIKAKAAELIDLIEGIKMPPEDKVDLIKEKRRLIIIAQDQIESAAMFAIKAATK